MSDFDSEKRDDESGIARVLRAAGERARPSDEMKATVRAAVHAEWRAVTAKRRQRRVWLATAASIVVAALALWVGRVYLVGSDELVASVSRSIGAVQLRSGAFGSWRGVPAMDGSGEGAATPVELRAGETVKTGSDGRLALQLRDGVSLRLDHDTRVAFVDAGRVDVLAGAVYIDAGATPNGSSERLQVGTPAGVVQHVGTQYEARIVDGGTRIRVREGRVDLLPETGGIQSASVGEQLLVTSSGAIQRDAIAPNDPQWAWASSTAPAFEIDGRPVHEFLMWVARELGHEVVYANPESEAEAARAVLSGSVAGLTPSEALAAVLPTTQLRGTHRDGKLEIALQ